MDSRTIPNLQGYLEAASASDDTEEQACAQNFLLDERPPVAAVDLYRPNFTTGLVSDLDDWYERHGDFAKEHLYIDPDESHEPYTFRPVNSRNRMTEIDKRLNLIRVEKAADSCMLRGHSFEEVSAQVDAYRSGDAAAGDFLQGLCDAWNAERDKRPVYVTTEIEVEDILADGIDDWAVQLRDRLGLGHLDPGPAGRPIEILVMRYTVAEMVAGLEGKGDPAIPTVLDGGLSCYFFPSPPPGPGAGDSAVYGRTVNLAPVASESHY